MARTLVVLFYSFKELRELDDSLCFYSATVIIPSLTKVIQWEEQVSAQGGRAAGYHAPMECWLKGTQKGLPHETSFRVGGQLTES